MERFTLRVRGRFEAAHHLRSYRGAPEAVHGHSWTVEAGLVSEALDDEGMAFDFVAVRRALAELTARFDHGDVNAVAPFDEISPTTEHLARFFYAELRERLPASGLNAVTVWEGPDCSATYERRDDAGAPDRRARRNDEPTKRRVRNASR